MFGSHSPCSSCVNCFFPSTLFLVSLSWCLRVWAWLLSVLLPKDSRCQSACLHTWKPSTNQLQQQPTAAAAASVCRQPTCCFQEPPWITESRQSGRWTSEGKPEDIFSIKYDLILLKLLFYVTYEQALLSFDSRSRGSWSKLHHVALKKTLNSSTQKFQKHHNHASHVCNDDKPAHFPSYSPEMPEL